MSNRVTCISLNKSLSFRTWSSLRCLVLLRIIHSLVVNLPVRRVRKCIHIQVHINRMKNDICSAACDRSAVPKCEVWSVRSRKHRLVSDTLFAISEKTITTHTRQYERWFNDNNKNTYNDNNKHNNTNNNKQTKQIWINKYIYYYIKKYNNNNNKNK